MNTEIAKQETYRGVLITVYRQCTPFGNFLSAIAGDTEIHRGPMLTIEMALGHARAWIDEHIAEVGQTDAAPTAAGFTRAELEAELARFVQHVRDSFDNGMAADVGPHTPLAFIAACAEVELTAAEEPGTTTPKTHIERLEEEEEGDDE
jgi:hypothetical protein